MEVARALALGLALALLPVVSGAATYYVSSATGGDGDDGLTPATAFSSVAHVNSLVLGPGDEVRFACGETWRADPLVITRSGADGSPIVFTSNPPGCADKPLLSGARPISGWSLYSGNIWVADLDAGANAGLFPNGVNLLFRGSQRLPFGRWPDIEGHADGGWAVIDSQPAVDRFSDAELPSADWSGAVAHIRGMTWYILNRQVVADLGSTLEVGSNLDCWAGSCAGWGYYLSNHPQTLSREGEWFHDAADNRVYLWTAAGPPVDVEAAVILSADGRYHGGVELGRDLAEHVSWLRVENMRIERWYSSGVSTPTNLEYAENSDVTLRDLDIRDVDDAGVRLSTWIWHAGAESGWRGGKDLLLERVLIERANHFGIDSYAHSSELRDVTITDVGLLSLAGASGIGCGFAGSGGTCTEAGAGIRLKRHLAAHSSHHLELRRVRLERIGMNGIDVFGDTVTIADSVIHSTCLTKSDCGAIRSYGSGTLATTGVHDITVSDVVIEDILASNAGCHPSYRYPLGFGLYIDHASRDVTAQRVTAARCRPTGFLYQSSTGDIADCVVHGTLPGTWGGAALRITGSGDATLAGTVLFSTDPTVNLISVDQLAQLPSSDGNALFSPYDDTSLCVASTCYDLAGWQTATGRDLGSIAHWYSLSPADEPRSTLFVNDTAASAPVDLSGGGWEDLQQQPVTALTLPAFGSEVLVRDPAWIFGDGFESGSTSAWSGTAQ